MVNPIPETIFLEGMVHGLWIRGNLPIEFEKYLWLSVPRDESVNSGLEVEYRSVDKLPVTKEIWSGSFKGGDGSDWGSLFEQSGRLGLQIRGRNRGIFRFDADLIEIEWMTGADNAAHYFYSCALPIWLGLRGVPVLHASAVSTQGKVILFAGKSGMGKSTMCSAMVRSGWKFVSDDGVAMYELEPGSWHCYPAPPLLRLWPSSSELRCSSVVDDEPGCRNPLPGKHILPLTQEFLSGTWVSDRLAAIYVLHRMTTSCEITVGKHSPGDALVRLVENSLTWAPMAALGSVKQNFAQLARIVSKTGVKRLEYPAGTSYWEGIEQNIRRDLDAC